MALTREQINRRDTGIHYDPSIAHGGFGSKITVFVQNGAGREGSRGMWSYVWLFLALTIRRIPQKHWKESSRKNRNHLILRSVKSHLYLLLKTSHAAVFRGLRRMLRKSRDVPGKKNILDRYRNNLRFLVMTLDQPTVP
jgi:hypothetical protein